MDDIVVDKYGRAIAMAFNRTIGTKLDGELISNAIMARSELMSTLIDPRRDVDAECHYPTTHSITAEQYKQLYDRDPIACRVVECLAKESWQVQPKVYETEDPEDDTEFEKAWDALQPMTSGHSYFKSDTSNSVWEYLQRVDILAGIGHFGVLLLGLDDGKNLQDPVDGIITANVSNRNTLITNRLCQVGDCYLTKTEEQNLRNLPNLSEQELYTLNCLANQRGMIINAMEKQKRRGNSKATEFTTREEDIQGSEQQYDTLFGLQGEAEYRPSPIGSDQQYFGVQFGPDERSNKRSNLKLLFLRPFDESLVQIVRYEWNINNPRFGMPVMYRVTLNDPREQHGGIGLPMATVFVHWSRIIHVADNLSSSEIFGAPRMRVVLNRLLDLQKIYGASAEGYWQAAFTGLSIETHPQLGGDVTFDAADMRDQLENYVNSLQRYLALTGVSAHTLAPQVSDPASQIDKHLEAICIQLGIPKRIFMGSERGELASSQDDGSWNDRIRARQRNFITPRIICPFVDRLIAVGVLPEPKQIEKESSEKGEDTKTDDKGSFSDDEGDGPTAEYLKGSGDEAEDEKTQTANEGDDEGEDEAEDEREDFEDDRANEEESEGAEDSPPTRITDRPEKSVGVKTKAGYCVVWPDLDNSTDQTRAQVAATTTQALATYVSGNVEAVMPLMEFYTKILKMDEQEAKDLVKAAEQQQREMEMESPQGAWGEQQFGLDDPDTPEDEGGSDKPPWAEEGEEGGDEDWAEEGGDEDEEDGEDEDTHHPFDSEDVENSVANAEFEEHEHPRGKDGKFVEKHGKSLRGNNTPTIKEGLLAEQYFGATFGSRAFKKWFGNSKVVDSAGKPLVVYHGTNVGLEQFEGSFFTDSPDTASAYAELKMLQQAVEDNDEAMEIVSDIMDEEGAESITDLSTKTIHDIIEGNDINIIPENAQVYPVYLRMENPLDLTDIGQSVGDVSELWKEMHHRGLLEESWDSLDDDVRAEIKSQYDGKAVYKFLENEGIQARAFVIGYDGVVFEDGDPRGEGTHRSWLVRDGRQIKSAMGNRGTFDPDDLKIINTAEFEEHEHPRDDDGKFAKKSRDNKKVLSSKPRQRTKFSKHIKPSKSTKSDKSVEDQLDFNSARALYRTTKGTDAAVNHALVLCSSTDISNVPTKHVPMIERALSHLLEDKFLNNTLADVKIHVIPKNPRRWGLMKGQNMYLAEDLLDNAGKVAAVIRHELEHMVLGRKGVPSGKQENQVRVVAGMWAMIKYGNMVKTNPKDAEGFRLLARHQGYKA